MALNYKKGEDVFLVLLKRNGIILAAYAVAVVALSFVPQFGMAAFWVVLFLMIGLIWANGVLVNHMSRLLAALLTSVITLVIGGGAVLLTIQVRRLFGG